MTVCDRHAWFYEIAKAWMTSSRFAPEIAWTQSLSMTALTEREFLQESAWVVLCSGFREEVVRQKFGQISFAFFDWESAALVASDGVNSVRIAKQYFGHERKLWAIVQIAELVDQVGFDEFRKFLVADPQLLLEGLPYVGPITAQHLFKNLGGQMAKSDRHLARLAASLGFIDCHQLCDNLAIETGDSIAVIDTVLWRFCEQHPQFGR